MAVFKCKMCGGTFEINNETVAVCQYCGTKQTLPKLDDDRKANLYDRANHFRRNNEFDKAMGIYEQILNEDSSDAEAYWSLVLCRYGIEYVEDPSTRKRLPTINRAQFTSVFDDEDYKSALQYADGYQKDVYEQEAAAINEIQKGILAISSQEEPFDVFICYKESDKNGRRTPDSVLATELYHELTREGFKVFFSRITLEDKLGTAYEPYIFAALNSSKVMVVLGTKPEYFGAVWVKNEWSRYLSLIKNGARKILIPAYKDMDPYDLPDEFSHLQAQDMSKLGFMQDLIRGVKKIVENNTYKYTIQETGISNEVSGNVIALIKRGYMALEDSEWDKADDFFEQALNQDAELAEAYLGKLMAELQIRTKEKLKDCKEPFDNMSNYQRTLRFAEGTLRKELVGYIEYINTCNEIAKKNAILEKAKNEMDEGVVSSYEYAIKLLESISGWKNADKLVCECKNKIGEIKTAAEADRLERERQAEIKRIAKEQKRKRKIKIIKIVLPIICTLIAVFVLLTAVIIPAIKYNHAIDLMNSGKFDDAYSAFQEIGNYKDSLKKAATISIKEIKNCSVGEYIKFGSYEQDNNISNGKETIEWLVLDKTDEKALVISKYALDCKPYNTNDVNVTWESCSLRNWLNDYFINTAFSEVEKFVIPTVIVSADKNPEYNTYSGNPSQDKIFLLSTAEVNKYLGFRDACQCEPTKYAKVQGLFASEYGVCGWWLRNQGKYPNFAVNVYVGGSIDKQGLHVYRTDVGVRPAMWIDFSKID